jgi:hypothetical protein
MRNRIVTRLKKIGWPGLLVARVAEARRSDRKLLLPPAFAERALLKLRHPERSEAKDFLSSKRPTRTQSKDLANFTTNAQSESVPSVQGR